MIVGWDACGLLLLDDLAEFDTGVVREFFDGGIMGRVLEGDLSPLELHGSLCYGLQ